MYSVLLAFLYYMRLREQILACIVHNHSLVYCRPRHCRCRIICHSTHRWHTDLDRRDNKCEMVHQLMVSKTRIVPSNRLIQFQTWCTHRALNLITSFRVPTVLTDGRSRCIIWSLNPFADVDTRGSIHTGRQYYTRSNNSVKSPRHNAHRTSSSPDAKPTHYTPHMSEPRSYGPQSSSILRSRFKDRKPIQNFCPGFQNSQMYSNK